MKTYLTRSKKRKENENLNISYVPSASGAQVPHVPICEFNEQKPSEVSDSDLFSDTDDEFSLNKTVYKSPLEEVANSSDIESADDSKFPENRKFSSNSNMSLPNPNLQQNISPAQVPSLDKDFAMKFIPEFNGNRDGLHKFINCCDILHNDLYSVADTQMFLNIIKSKLTGLAYNITKYKEFSDWKELKNILQEQFLESRTLGQIQIELVNCKQSYRETVRSFANRVEKLLADLNDVCVNSEGINAATAITNLNSKTALKAFIEGLHPSLKLIIKASRFQRLTDAVEMAVEEEKSTPQTFKPYSSTPSSKAKCSFCNKVGHTSATCFLKTKYTSSRFPSSIGRRLEFKREPSPQTFHNVRTVTCSYCKIIGHHIRDCRKRAYNEAQRSQSSSSSNRDSRNNSYMTQGNEIGPGATGGAARAQDIKKRNN